MVDRAWGDRLNAAVGGRGEGWPGVGWPDNAGDEGARRLLCDTRKG